MKKIVLSILLIVVSLLAFPNDTFAVEYFEKIEFRTAFDESINTNEISDIKLSFQLDASAQGFEDPEFLDVTLTREENFYKTFTNVVYGDLYHKGIRVGLDAGSQDYASDLTVTYSTEKTVVVQIIVTQKDLSTTKSTADMSSFEDTIKEHFLTEEERIAYEEYIQAQKEINKTTTTTSPGITIVVTDPVSGKPIIDPSTGKEKTTVIITTTASTTTTNKLTPGQQQAIENEKKEKEEKEKRDKKENLILAIMFGIIGCVVVVGGIFVVIKIYQASKIG